MNPVNATALYVSASRAVLRCDPRQPHTFAEMYKQLPSFRQSLACRVCGKLLQNPISPTHPECQHYVCLGCKGQKMRIRLSCSRCKDYSCFQENKQLSLLVQCYQNLCLYVTQSPLLQSISSHAGGSPEVMTLLEEVLMSHVEETETDDLIWLQEDVNLSAPESLTPTEAPPVPTKLSAIPQNSSSEPPCFNGPQECNGEALEDLDPSSPELEVCELVEEQQHAGLAVSDTACGLELSLTTGPLTPTPGTVCSLRDGESCNRELEEGEVLLLSVEEVLQTLDPLQPGRDSLHSQPERIRTHTTTDRAHNHMYLQLDAAHNYTQIQTGRTITVAGHGAHTQASSLEPSAVSKLPTIRLNRKRSRSESDREQVKPLPIVSILQGSSYFHTPTSPHTLHTKLPTPSIAVPVHTYSSLPNGMLPKSSRPVQNSKGVRKHMEQSPKKPHAKARSSGGSKTKDRSKEQRLLSGCLLPAPPVRPPYKKPAEKKGCKCGRATQNPSVLTCRGQRCPCYSNRKACLDCICRGCQNSYMANGEKKLEAFAVPEKALEQTRLTLGINLTSITAAAALRNPATSSIRANTLLNVATATGTPVTTAFLSPSPPQDPNFEDSLELLIG
ncbi:E3 ubiquitin-protein ligase MSL2 [Nematolebias whitei]|uniref:E3 ubiquitin-protein ligase MSL2 n=1 Tax=Nematolebias whitei TaxID=451745 RepID=UPI001899E9BD|nr:E3 ubiquitin-protein ligase MSL2 [Nematolebias whitei]